MGESRGFLGKINCSDLTDTTACMIVLINAFSASLRHLRIITDQNGHFLIKAEVFRPQNWPFFTLKLGILFKKIQFKQNYFSNKTWSTIIFWHFFASNLQFCG